MNIILTKAGEILINKNPHKPEETKEVVEVDLVSYMLGANVDVEDGFKVKHLFKVLEKYPDLITINHYIIHFLEDFKKHSETAKQSNLDDIIIQRVFNETFYKDNCPYENYIDITARDHNPTEPNTNKDTRWSCSFVGLEEVREAKILMFPGLYTKYYKKGSKKYKKSRKNKTPLYKSVEFCTEYSLFEFIDSIFFEFSFHGLKDERTKEKDKLDSIIDELEGKTTKELIKEGKLVSSKNVFKKLKLKNGKKAKKYMKKK